MGGRERGNCCHCCCCFVFGPGIFPFRRVQTAEFFPASTPKAEPQQEGRQPGRGGGGRLDSSLTLLSSTICECIFYAANNLIKILCVCLGPIKVIIEGRPPLLTNPSCPPTQ